MHEGGEGHWIAKIRKKEEEGTDNSDDDQPATQVEELVSRPFIPFGRQRINSQGRSPCLEEKGCDSTHESRDNRDERYYVAPLVEPHPQQKESNRPDDGNSDLHGCMYYVHVPVPVGVDECESSQVIANHLAPPTLQDGKESRRHIPGSDSRTHRSISRTRRIR